LEVRLTHTTVSEGQRALAVTRKEQSVVRRDKDSDKRQRAAIAAFAKAHGYLIVGEFYDAAVSGADPIAERPGFKAMLDRRPAPVTRKEQSVVRRDKDSDKRQRRSRGVSPILTA
jgi:hypothetical protein